MGVKGLFTSLGLRTDDTVPSTPAPVIHSTPAQVLPAPQLVPAVSALADPEVVNKLKSMTLGASAIIAQFMQNLAIAKSQFPHDDMACMKAALAFTRVEKSVLLEEINRTVSAALQHAKKSMETDRQKAREGSAGSLDRDLVAADASIKEMEARVIDLQQQISNKRTERTDLQTKIQTVEADLRRQDDIVNASFTEVEQYVAQLAQTFARI